MRVSKEDVEFIANDETLESYNQIYCRGCGITKILGPVGIVQNMARDWLEMRAFIDIIAKGPRGSRLEYGQVDYTVFCRVCTGRQESAHDILGLAYNPDDYPMVVDDE